MLWIVMYYFCFKSFNETYRHEYQGFHEYQDYTASAFDETIDLVAKSGQCAVPQTILCRIVHNQNSSKGNLTLFLQSNDDKVKMARKLHCQIAHAPSDKSLKLVSLAGRPWSSDSELKR